MIFKDNQLIGDTQDFLDWAIEKHNFEDFRNEILYETLRKEAYANYISNTKVFILKSYLFSHLFYNI